MEYLIFCCICVDGYYSSVLSEFLSVRMASFTIDDMLFKVFHTVVGLLSVRVPTRTGKSGKPGKMGRHFPVREKSGNFEQTGKVRENHSKYWKT